MSDLSFGSCSGAECDCNDCDCDCTDCNCDCNDCDCLDCNCDWCKDCCGDFCFICCATANHCAVECCSDYICNYCFFQTTTTTDGRQRSDSYDNYHNETHYGSHCITQATVPITSPPDWTTHGACTNKSPKEPKKKYGEDKDEDKMSPEELEQIVMAGEDVRQPEKQNMTEDDLHPTTPPTEIGEVTLQNVRSEYETTTAAEANARGMDDHRANQNNDQSMSFLGGKIAIAMDEEENRQRYPKGSLMSPHNESNVQGENASLAYQNQDTSNGYDEGIGIMVDANYPAVDPPSYDDIVVTQPGGSEALNK